MDIPGINIQLPQANQAVKPQDTAKSFQDVLQQTSSPAGMGKIIKLATSGRSFTPTELLAVQAGVYKFSQELELTSKVVEKATDGVKQTLQTQV